MSTSRASPASGAASAANARGWTASSGTTVFAIATAGDSGVAATAARCSSTKASACVSVRSTARAIAASRSTRAAEFTWTQKFAPPSRSDGNWTSSPSSTFPPSDRLKLHPVTANPRAQSRKDPLKGERAHNAKEAEQHEGDGADPRAQQGPGGHGRAAEARRQGRQPGGGRPRRGGLPRGVDPWREARVRLQAQGPLRPGHGPGAAGHAVGRQSRRLQVHLPVQRRRHDGDRAGALDAEQAARARLQGHVPARCGALQARGGLRLPAARRSHADLLHRQLGPVPDCYVGDYLGCDEEQRDPAHTHPAAQFSKVEMFAFCANETQAQQFFDEMVEIQTSMYAELGLHYELVDMATGDLGAPAYRKFDLLAWMPGREEYGEVSSMSMCTDYQARRLNIRHKDPKDEEAGTSFVHTLNGTACAVPRLLISLWETYQQEDGSIVIPEVLRPYMGGQEVIRRPE
ncbi:hypothetical protein ON010_g17348 [Phytophthora cinnamomi]|nr:hypothetical protein ON010_g17348 [Phytophthora cinnamomi]